MRTFWTSQPPKIVEGSASIMKNVKRKRFLEKNPFLCLLLVVRTCAVFEGKAWNARKIEIETGEGCL